MTKVYCKNCKHHNYPNIDGHSIYHYCRAFRTYYDTWYQRTFQNPECVEINMDNVCDAFEEKRKWWKFWVK